MNLHLLQQKNRNSMIYKKSAPRSDGRLASKLSYRTDGNKSVVVAERPKNMNSDIFELAINIYRSEAIQAIYLYKLLRHHIKKSSESKWNCTQHIYIFITYIYTYIFINLHNTHKTTEHTHSLLLLLSHLILQTERE